MQQILNFVKSLSTIFSRVLLFFTNRFKLFFIISLLSFCSFANLDFIVDIFEITELSLQKIDLYPLIKYSAIFSSLNLLIDHLYSHKKTDKSLFKNNESNPLGTISISVKSSEYDNNSIPKTSSIT